MDNNASIDTISVERHQVSQALDRAGTSELAGEILAVVVPDGAGDDLELLASIYRHLRGQRVDTVVVVSSSRSARSGRIAIPGGDGISSAFGRIRIDDAVRNELCDEDDDIYVDESGNQAATVVAAQLPFLLETLGEFSIVPIVMGDESAELRRELAAALSEIAFNRRTLIVATSGMIEGDDESLSAVRDALDRRDITALQKQVTSGDSRFDGHGPVLTAIEAASDRRARAVEIVRCDRRGIAALVYRPS